MGKKSSANYQCCILDCLTGKRMVTQNFPSIIGAGAESEFRLEHPGVPETLCKISKSGDFFELNFSCPSDLDGAESQLMRAAPEEEHSAAGTGWLLAFKFQTEGAQWQREEGQPSWHVYDKETSEWHGPFIPALLRSWIERRSTSARQKLIFVPSGMEQMGFFIGNITSILRLPAPAPQPLEKMAWFNRHENPFNKDEIQHPLDEPVIEAVNSEYGEFTCPVCWFKFDRGDAMNIAVHNSLRGDPILGEDQMQRFHATRFNDRGQALDAMGLPTSDLACPHCRRKLPPGFLDLPHHIFSIVGAPSSGKSYYLSVLVKLLQSTLFKSFGITFRDADPSENVILTQMKTQLFSSSSAADAFLAKTDLEGALYETLPRQGRKVRLPKPFIFRLSHPDLPENGFSVVFYDNAGEHFEPTRNSADSPGAQHIAVASGIFFLFDPLHNAEFRAKIKGSNDPQIKSQRQDQQDVILAESEVRIKSLLGMDSRQRVPTPLAVMVGKCDTWESLLGEPPLLPALKDGAVSLENIKANSARVRKLLLETCPSIVANAEAMSSNVCYFAISPLGCSPVEFIDREGTPRIGPDPQQISPRHVEGPTLWVLSQAVPEMIPSHKAS